VACDLSFEGPVARVRVRLQARVGDDDVFVREALIGSERQQELQADLTGIVQRAFGPAPVHVASVTFEQGSIEAVALIATTARFVIGAGDFLAGLRQIRDAMPDPIRRYVEDLLAPFLPDATVHSFGARLELLSGALDGLLVPETGSPAPAPATSSQVNADVIWATTGLIIVAGLIASFSVHFT
jgi:hypothetical protein